MGSVRIVERERILSVLVDEVGIRCRYRRRGKRIFTWAIKELRANWQSQRARFQMEIKP